MCINSRLHQYNQPYPSIKIIFDRPARPITLKLVTMLYTRQLPFICNISKILLWFRKKITGILQVANKCQLTKVISKFIWVIPTQMAQTPYKTALQA